MFINISGCRYETTEATLHRYPDSLLGNKAKRDIYYNKHSNEYFFNRCRQAFDAILFFYQSSGCLLRPPDLPMEEFELECIFFQVGDEPIRRMKSREGFDPERRVKPAYNSKGCRQKLYNFMEIPESSRGASWFQMMSLSAILFTIGLDCADTIPGLIKHKQNGTVVTDPWKSAKFGLNIYFAVEYILRLATAPKKCKFIIAPLNVIDILAIVPTFVTPIIDEQHASNLVFIRAIRTFRVLRMLRLSKQSELITVVLHILSESLEDLFMLVFCMTISCIVFGSMTYYLELGAPNSPFNSIPEGMWFSMQTVVCLGYGDIVPVSIGGKIAAAVTAVFGALTLTVPLLSLGGRYFSIYTTTYSVSLGPDLVPPMPTMNIAKKIESEEGRTGMMILPRPIPNKMPQFQNYAPTSIAREFPWQNSSGPQKNSRDYPWQSSQATTKKALEYPWQIKRK